MRLRFERGTILLEGAPRGFDVADLPGTLWDPRVRSFRAPASRYREIIDAAGAAGVPITDVVRPPWSTGTARWTEPELRPYQEASLDAWIRAGKRGTIVLPTGSGKTRVAMAAMARQDAATLVLVPTLVLLEQWCKEVARFYDGQVGWYGGGVRSLARVTVSTYASAERHLDRLGNRFDMLVVDEAHNLAGGMSGDLLDMSIASARIGLTATPPHHPESLERLSLAIGPVVYELAVGDLAGGFLAPYDLITLAVDLTPRERLEYEREVKVFRQVFIRFRAQNPHAEWTGFARAANRSADGRRALAAWRRANQILAYTTAKRAVLADLMNRHRDARVLVFTSNNETAYSVSRDRLIMPITCDIGRRERQAALDRFRTGELRALVSARVLNEGLDVPDADVAIVIGGSLGAREHVQRIGRLLRPGQGKRALVYELVTRATSEVARSRRRRSGLAARVSAQL